jgi:uncharacterized 2Fe-2S/4Fe-4S cluster protein (DUF4445 family)
MTDSYSIDFEPLGRRGKAAPGQTLLHAAQTAGVGLASVCGGVGTCEECRVRLVSGSLTALTLVEETAFCQDEIANGMRLACQAEPLSDVKVDIPSEALTSAQRLQLDGEEQYIEINPAFHAPGTLGLAVDIGTTKLAAYLVNLETGRTLARAGAMNPQIAYGEDVISRIAFTIREMDGGRKLQSLLVESINNLVTGMCSDVQVSRTSVMEAVLVGNTVMHHLIAGLPVEQLGYAPFSPSTVQPITIPARDLGMDLGPAASVYLPPVIAGYVGSDHLAMLRATGAWKSPQPTIALDIGTNTEIAFISGAKILCCSCASGPAFEGAHIHEGMRASPGAIERARWSAGKILWQTIADQPPVGICGSGILDVVAALMDGNLVRPTGALKTVAGSDYALVPSAQTGLGHDLLVTRKDIHEIQLAKSAIRSGVEILLREANLTYSDLDRFIVAGAFGTYLDLHSAVRIGMFPPIPVEKFHQVGNAAGMGAKQMLVSLNERQEAERLAKNINYVELTSLSSFTSLFMEHLYLNGKS